MNTPIFTCDSRYTKTLFQIVIVTLATLVFTETARAEWSIDFSRRASKVREADLNSVAQPNDRRPASVKAGDSDGEPANVMIGADAPKESPHKKGVFDVLFDAGEPVQDIVILHTDKGFVPSTVRVRKGGKYRFHVVNVNEKEKNVSFILDGFSEHHATYYGKIKTFILEPKKEGAFSFQSPETSSEGKLVVFNPQMNLRAPASEE